MAVEATIEPRGSVRAFVLLLFALSVPLWVVGAISQVELFPGFMLYQLPLGMPAVAALILTYRDDGRGGVGALLRRTYDVRRFRPLVWLLPVLLFYPAVGLLGYTILGLSGVAVPPLHVSVPVVLGYSTVFLMTYGEELGLTGYAIDRLQPRWSALATGLLLGLVWAAYHVPGFVISGFYSFEWMFWHGMYTIAARVLFVWVYNNSGKSLFSMALFHWTYGFFSTLLPPTDNLQKASPYYDPGIAAGIAVGCAVAVTLLWGARTLTDRPRRRSASTAALHRG